MSAHAVFLEGSLMRHVVRMSLTSSVGLMAMFAVDFVDMVFISMLGNDALAAAVGYAATILFFTNAINIGLSIAAGSLVARAIGADNDQDASEYATNVAGFAILTGLLVPLLILPNCSSLLTMLGAQDDVLDLAGRYVSIILPSMSIMGIAMTAMAVLRAHGDARRSMMVTLYGGIVNAVLDPILIFGLDMGLDGAAWASVAARIAMAALAIYPAIKVFGGFALPSLAAMKRDFAPISGIAVPAVLTNVATPVGSAIVIRFVAGFGNEAVAGMAVIGRLTPLAFAVVFALSGAIGPIIGQNFGAKRPDRVRVAFIAGIKFVAVFVIGMSALLFLLRIPIADLFKASGETRDLIYLFCGPLALASFFNGVIFVANASFNNLGHPLYSTMINWGRNTVGTWPFAIVGAHMAGASGVLVGQAFGGVVFAILAWWLAYRVMTRASVGAPEVHFVTEGRFHALFTRRGW